MVGGYAGKILEIDLTTRSLHETPLDYDEARKYLGGSGLAAKVLYDRVGPEVDPLSPENLLIFMAGPLTGTPAPTSGRHAVVTKSPATGIFAESDSGGTWGQALKWAGYDGIIISGKASSPTYLWVKDGDVRIRDASHLWGKDSYETDDIIKSSVGERAVVACIGPAGERLCKLAAIMNDGYDGRTTGRAGVGAVMGSKNLKAIAVEGSRKPSIVRRGELLENLKTIIPQIKEYMVAMTKFGTGNGIVATEASGDMPIKNWRQGSFVEGAGVTSGQYMAEHYLVRNYHCASCPIGCGRVIKVENGPYKTAEGAGPEYETLTALGALCLNDNLEVIMLGNELCNRYGVDTISAGAAIAFAMEAYEKGMISQEDAGGLDLRWGNPEAIIGLIHQIGKGEGLGLLLGEGVRIASERLGGLAPEWAIHVKGLECAMHDPRAYHSMATGYATGNRGGCHLQSASYLWERGPQAFKTAIPTMPFEWYEDRHGLENKGKLTVNCQNLMSVMDSLKLCKFVFNGRVGIENFANWTSCITGLDISADELMEAGERLYNLKRMYNVRHGISRKDDTLPSRILSHKRGTGGSAEFLPKFGEQLSEYYDARGWTEEGIPAEETLRRLGLDFAVKHLPVAARI
ncbi:MAG: aldehyde ferredoxin oxidoreductase family protein [Chloroflexi bacterium]|nr:aldehyde ferredoxin oxidoreductase family protein [Chloroflexota bacterium]